MAEIGYPVRPHVSALRQQAAELLRSANAADTDEAATQERKRAHECLDAANRIETAARPPRRRAEWLSPEYDE
jgi:hypothetical protein